MVEILFWGLMKLSSSLPGQSLDPVKLTASGRGLAAGRRLELRRVVNETFDGVLYADKGRDLRPLLLQRGPQVCRARGREPAFDCGFEHSRSGALGDALGDDPGTPGAGLERVGAIELGSGQFAASGRRDRKRLAPVVAHDAEIDGLQGLRVRSEIDIAEDAGEGLIAGAGSAAERIARPERFAARHGGRRVIGTGAGPAALAGADDGIGRLLAEAADAVGAGIHDEQDSDATQGPCRCGNCFGGWELRFGDRLWFRGDAVCLRKLRGRRCRIGLAGRLGLTLHALLGDPVQLGGQAARFFLAIPLQHAQALLGETLFRLFLHGFGVGLGCAFFIRKTLLVGLAALLLGSSHFFGEAAGFGLALFHFGTAPLLGNAVLLRLTLFFSEPLLIRGALFFSLLCFPLLRSFLCLPLLRSETAFFSLVKLLSDKLFVCKPFFLGGALFVCLALFVGDPMFFGEAAFLGDALFFCLAFFVGSPVFLGKTLLRRCPSRLLRSL